MKDYSDHDIWRLSLTVGMRGLEAVFYNKNTRSFDSYVSRVWECPDADVLKNVENAVYDDSLLPDGYDTSVLIRPKATLLVPADTVDADNPDTWREALDAVDASEQKDVWYESMGDVAVLYSTPRGIKDFLSRTFLTEDIHHIDIPFAVNVLSKAHIEGGEKMWVHYSDDVIDIVACRDGVLLHAGFWYCPHGADAVYYTLFAWNALGFDPRQGELRISGMDKYRAEVMTALRKHIHYVSLAVCSSAASQAMSAGVHVSTVLNRF